MKQFGKELRNLRDAARLSQQRLAKLTGVPQSAINRIENGDSTWSKHIPVLQEFFQVTPTEALTRPSVPVIGYVGAGAEIFPIDDHSQGAGFDEIPAPPGVFRAIALVIKGDSMWPRYQEGDVVVIDKEQYSFDSLIGKTCYILLEDGRSFLKILQSSKTKGFWDLISHNAPPIEGVLIDRAYPVSWVKPKP